MLFWLPHSLKKGRCRPPKQGGMQTCSGNVGIKATSPNGRRNVGKAGELSSDRLRLLLECRACGTVPANRLSGGEQRRNPYMVILFRESLQPRLDDREGVERSIDQSPPIILNILADRGAVTASPVRGLRRSFARPAISVELFAVWRRLRSLESAQKALCPAHRTSVPIQSQAN